MEVCLIWWHSSFKGETWCGITTYTPVVIPLALCSFNEKKSPSGHIAHLGTHWVWSWVSLISPIIYGTLSNFNFAISLSLHRNYRVYFGFSQLYFVWPLFLFHVINLTCCFPSKRHPLWVRACLLICLFIIVRYGALIAGIWILYLRQFCDYRCFTYKLLYSTYIKKALCIFNAADWMWIALFVCHGSLWGIENLWPLLPQDTALSYYGRATMLLKHMQLWENIA